MTGPVVAIVTARRGSRRLPRKNVLPLGDKPVILHSVDAALDSAEVDRVLVTSDDPEVLDIVSTRPVDSLMRPAELATDTCRSEAVVAHALDYLSCNSRPAVSFALLQPTSPFRTATHIDAALALFRNQMQRGSVVAVRDLAEPPQKSMAVKADGTLVPLTGWDDLTSPAQQLPRAVLPNGALYVGDAAVFRDRPFFFHTPCRPYLMSAEDSLDIDTAADLEACRRQLSARPRTPPTATGFPVSPTSPATAGWTARKPPRLHT